MATEDADGMKAVYLTNIDLEASHDSHLVKFDSHRMSQRCLDRSWNDFQHENGEDLG